MPFNNSEWIKYCNPIKMKEYLAAGLPVVSINIKQAKPYSELLYLASTHDEFLEKLKLAVHESSSDPSRELRRKRVSSETWKDKVQQIKDIANS
jgi:hypothetical protein